ncbi:hypothetical protein HYT55_02100 [Candidatus Woesearchaeota archaeon]|nr:hypothetical protein [Candidatus Woesearchaeota archaeon]
MADDLLDLEEAVLRAKTRISGSVSTIANLYEEDRNKCYARGYHRVGSDEDRHGELRICYDCELFFGKNDGVSYRVEPL